jgi:hypothetical protein
VHLLVSDLYEYYKMWKLAVVTHFKVLLWHLFEEIQETSKSLSHLRGLRIHIWKQDIYNSKHNYCSAHHVVRQNVCWCVDLENENSAPIWNVFMLLICLHYGSSRTIMFMLLIRLHYGSSRTIMFMLLICLHYGSSRTIMFTNSF